MPTNVRYFDASEALLQDMLEANDFENAEAVCVVVCYKDGTILVGRSWDHQGSPFTMAGALEHTINKWLEDFTEEGDEDAS